jgi:AraC-like DNA-binding protein
MDWAIKNMDVAIKQWGSYRRSFPSAFPLMLMDFIRQKRHWMRDTFGTCNFSLILGGGGEYWRFGQKWIVEAPCVITQLPGEPVEYGPAGPEGTWDELFLMYDARFFTAFEQQHLVDRSQPIWPILNVSAVEARLSELLALCASPAPAQAVDRVDRLCELLILETHLQPPQATDDSDDQPAIRQIERELASDLHRDIDLEGLVVRHRMSLATFRRRWSEVISVPPTRYRLQVRLREACRMLTETTRPVYEIARLVGFPDELYFSRRFHQELKVSPRTYRQMHQVHRETKHA